MSKQAIGILGCVALATALACAISSESTMDGYHFDFEGASATRSASQELESGVERLAVEHRFGTVDVQAVGPGETPSWSWDLEVWADTAAEAEAWLPQVQLAVERLDTAMSWTLVLPERPARGLEGVRSRLVLRVPADVEVALANAFGPSRVARIAGDVECTTAHGDLELEALAAGLRVQHRHGSVKGHDLAGGRFDVQHGATSLSDVAGDLTLVGAHGDVEVERIAGALSLERQHGEILVVGAGETRARGAHGAWQFQGVAGLDLEHQHGDVTASLSGGNVRAKMAHGSLVVARAGDADVPRADIESQHGDVELWVGTTTCAEVDVAHGNVRVHCPPGFSGALAAAASFGDVRSALPVVASVEANRPGLRLVTRHGDIDVSHSR